MYRTMTPALKRFVLAAMAFAAAQAFAIAGTPVQGQAQATRCPAPNSYCHAANCTGSCTTLTCNGQGNCDPASSTKECYECKSNVE